MGVPDRKRMRSHGQVMEAGSRTTGHGQQVMDSGGMSSRAIDSMKKRMRREDARREETPRKETPREETPREKQAGAAP